MILMAISFIYISYAWNNIDLDLGIDVQSTYLSQEMMLLCISSSDKSNR